MLLPTEDILKSLYKMRIMQELIKLGMWSMKFDYPWDYRKSKKN